jgi:hypothetical protein
MQKINTSVTIATTSSLVQLILRLTHQSMAQPITTGMMVSNRNGVTLLLSASH